MIDTDKYEGHTKGIWEVGEFKGRPCVTSRQDSVVPRWAKSVARSIFCDADAQLIADAPLLLAEIKRLYGILGDITAVDEWGGDGQEVGITITFEEGGSYTGWLNKEDEVTE